MSATTATAPKFPAAAAAAKPKKQNGTAAAAAATTNGSGPAPVRKVAANHDTNHAKRSRSPEPRTSSSSGDEERKESTSDGNGSGTSSSNGSSATPAAVVAPAKPPEPVAPPTIKGSGPNGELTLKDIAVANISFQEVYNPEHEGPPLTKVIIYKPKGGKGQPTAKVIVTKVFTIPRAFFCQCLSAVVFRCCTSSPFCRFSFSVLGVVFSG